MQTEFLLMNGWSTKSNEISQLAGDVYLDTLRIISNRGVTRNVSDMSPEFKTVLPKKIDPIIAYCYGVPANAPNNNRVVLSPVESC